MAGDLCLGIDIGTTNVKASILDTQTHTVVASASAEHPLFHPRPGWAEQEPGNYWDAVAFCIRGCLAQGSGLADRVAGIALSGLVGVTLPVDASGRPLHRALIWMDGRSEAECADIRERVGEEKINHVNGNRIAPWFIEPKALWLKKNEPSVFKETHKFLSPSGYCTLRLTGAFRSTPVMQVCSTPTSTRANAGTSNSPRLLECRRRSTRTSSAPTRWWGRSPRTPPKRPGCGTGRSSSPAAPTSARRRLVSG